MHGIDLDDSERRKTMQVKLAEKRFRAKMVNNRDRMAFFFGMVSFFWIAFLCLVAGKSTFSMFVYATGAMIVMFMMGFVFGSLLLRCKFTDEFAKEHMGDLTPRSRRVRMTVRVDRAQAGMVLERAAMAPDGRQVLLSGTRLGPADLVKLRQQGVHEIAVIAEVSQEEETPAAAAASPPAGVGIEHLR